MAGRQGGCVHTLSRFPLARGHAPVGEASVDNLTVHALIDHNAHDPSEMTRLKGTRNQDYGEELATGDSPRKVVDWRAAEAVKSKQMTT